VGGLFLFLFDFYFIARAASGLKSHHHHFQPIDAICGWPKKRPQLWGEAEAVLTRQRSAAAAASAPDYSKVPLSDLFQKNSGQF
jgi:hypothetical protein